MEPRRSDGVAVTGMGAVTPLGLGVSTLYERWAAGESAIVDGCAWCEEFVPEHHLTRRELRNTDRFAQLAAAACQEALSQAGWESEQPYPADRVACVIGTAQGGVDGIERQHQAFLVDRSRVSPLGATRFMSNAPAAILAMRHGWMGEVFGMSAACAAGGLAIGAGARLLRTGEADAAIVGGADARFTGAVAATFDVMRAISPSGVPRPFDRRRDGFVASEGAGVLVLEHVESARARGATVLGIVAGFASTNDAYHLASPRPDGRAAVMAMRRALSDAAIEPATVAYVNAHGTSTALNDRLEAQAISEVFGTDVGTAPKVSSLKSAVGHLQGAAGAVEAIATLVALRAGVAPPTVGLEEPDVEGEAAYVRGAPAPLDEARGRPFVGVSNSFGLGGHNATVALRAT